MIRFALIGAVVLSLFALLVVPEILAKIGVIILIFSLFVLGLKKVPVAHLGQILIWGERKEAPPVGEGWTWVLPVIQDLRILDGRIQIRTLVTPFVFSKDNVRVSFSVCYFSKIRDPYRFLSTREEEIWDGIDRMIERESRRFVLAHRGKECRRVDELLVEELLSKIRAASNQWGIEITELAIADVSYTKEYEEALETEKRREYRVKGDAREMRSLSRRVKRTSEELGLSTEKCAELDLINREKIKKEIKRFDVGENLMSIFSELGQTIGKTMARRRK